MSRYAGGKRYEAWRGLIAGAFAMDRCRDLLRTLLAGWPRRSRSVLAFNAGNGTVLETLWEAGFDVTGQDSDPAYLELARTHLGSRADFVLSAPDHLPFDDSFFDYAVAVAALEFWETPETVLKEIGRVACGGLILIFPSAWSLFSLECRLRRRAPLCAAVRHLLLSPRKVNRLLRHVYGDKKTVWSSILPGPSHTWTDLSWPGQMNRLKPPLPVGAFTGVRVDFGPYYTGTPLLLRSSDPVASLN
jgi:SAM-dependent methyltransferase